MNNTEKNATQEAIDNIIANGVNLKKQMIVDFFINVSNKKKWRFDFKRG